MVWSLVVKSSSDEVQPPTPKRWNATELLAMLSASPGKQWAALQAAQTGLPLLRSYPVTRLGQE